MAYVARELARNPAAVFEVDRRLRVERSKEALAQLSVGDRVLVRLLTDTETYASELATKIGVSRTAINKAVGHLEAAGLVMTHMESELPEQLKRPQQRRITLTASGKPKAADLRQKLEDQASPFDELWAALRKSQDVSRRMMAMRLSLPVEKSRSEVGQR